MRHLLVLLFIILFQKSFAQDERMVREFLEYKPPAQIEDARTFTRRKAMTPYYKADLNGDLREEKILIEKNDGIDFITIRDYTDRVVFRQRLDTQGIDSRVHRIRVKKISPKSTILMVYYYEGIVDYLEFRGTGRLYFITLDNNDLETLSMFKGPFYWQEHKGFKDNYFQRKYEVSFTDLNEDGTKDVLVKHHLISRAYVYLGKGKWKSYNKPKGL